MTIKDVKEFFEREYKDCVGCASRPSKWLSLEEVKKGAIQRCLGVAQFCQKWVPYEVVEPVYCEYKEKIEEVQ